MPHLILTTQQVDLLRIAQALFILNQITNFPLYYFPGFRGALGGDSETKFPCSISWMTRKGLPRISTLLMWNVGWFCMLYAFVMSATSGPFELLFMLQMYVTGFVVVVLTPMKGPDVALGKRDALHCYAAMIYVADHFLVNQLVLGVPLSSPYGWGFVVTSGLCGLCQFLRADGDKAARVVHARVVGSKRMSLDRFCYVLELGFMFFENALFFVFLFGMTSGTLFNP